MKREKGGKQKIGLHVWTTAVIYLFCKSFQVIPLRLDGGMVSMKKRMSKLPAGSALVSSESYLIAVFFQERKLHPKTPEV